MISPGLGDRLRHAIAARGETQSRVAKRAGMRANALSEFVTGARRPNLATVAALCRVLNLSADWLLFGPTLPPPPPRPELPAAANLSAGLGASAPPRSDDKGAGAGGFRR